MFTAINNQVGCFHHWNKKKYKMQAAPGWMVENKIKARTSFHSNECLEAKTTTKSSQSTRLVL